MEFEESYFKSRDYRSKEQLVKRNVVEIIKWASNVAGVDYADGKGQRALDVGCAYGYTTEALAGLGYETCGVDVSRWGVQKAKAKSAGDVLVCDAQAALPFEADSFDLVTGFDVLEHLRFPESALRNMLAACRGSLICTTPNRRVEKPVRKLTGDYDETHVNVKSAGEWKKCVKNSVNSGLVKVETFFDVTGKLAKNGVFFKSVKLPGLGLTVRILVKK